MRHQVRRKLNLAHNQYLQEILGISKTEDASEPDKSSHSAKKLYAMLNRSKNDSRCISSLNKDGKLYTESKDKADILNSRFQSVFIPKTPLALGSLAKMAVQDLIDAGKMDSKSVPANLINTQLVMPDIQLSENGILKLLKDLNPHKAAGPDELKPLVLKELREVIGPMLRVIFQRSFEAGRVPRD